MRGLVTIEAGCVGSLGDAVEVCGDGGVLLASRSTIAASWAWCATDAGDARVAWGSGLIVPGDVWGESVTNNKAEFAAVLAALSALPDGWSGRVCSDSAVTLGRLFAGWATRGLPDALVARAAAHRRRLGVLVPVQLDGHPTRAQLASGIGKRGNTVRAANVWADGECRRLLRGLDDAQPAYLAALRRAAEGAA